MEMYPEDVSALNVQHIGEKECLQQDDNAKYAGMTKFNPKSFKSGPSVGYISVPDVSIDLLFAQVKMTMNEMFDVLRLRRFNHLVGNGGSKVWPKQTAQTVIMWKQKMTCPMYCIVLYCFYILKWQVHINHHIHVLFLIIIPSPQGIIYHCLYQSLYNSYVSKPT